MNKNSPKILKRPAMTVIGMNIRTLPMAAEIPALWPRFVGRMAEIEGRTEPKVTYGVMRGGPDVLNYLAGVAVSSPARVPAGMETLIVPAGTYAAFEYPLSGLGKGFHEIFSRLLPASDYDVIPAPYLERYGESFCPDDPQSVVEILLPVRSRA
jgi:predicted transcriptional regulator YdeE